MANQLDFRVKNGLIVGGDTNIAGAITSVDSITLSGGTVNGVLYLNGSKEVTSGTVLTFDGTTLGTTGALRVDGNTTLGNASTDTVTVNGYMGVGGAPATNRAVSVVNTALSGTTQSGVVANITGTSGATSGVNGLAAEVGTAAAVFTAADVAGLIVQNASKGAGSTITNQHGVRIADQTQGTNNYGITSLVSSGTNKWNIYASGTAQNYFAGNVGIGTSSPTYKLDAQTTATGTLAGDNTVAYFGSLASGRDANIRFGDNVNASGRIGYLGGALYMYTSGAERLRVTITGSVGIGTTNPATKFVVSDAGALGIEFDPTSGGMQVYNRSTSAYGTMNLLANTIYFRTGASPAINMTVAVNGFVGIANTNPLARLQVEELGIDTTTTIAIAGGQTAIYSASTTAFRTLELMVQITEGSSYHSVKLFVLHNGTDVWFNQTNVLHTAAELGAFSMDISGGNVRLLYTPTSTTTVSTVKVAAMKIAV